MKSSLLLLSLFTTAHAVVVHEPTADFVPLSCNDAGFSPCQPWSEYFGNTMIQPRRLIVPCGECVHIDVNFAHALMGLDIQGKLLLDTPTTLQATMVLVQGEMEITSTEIVRDGPRITVLMIGEEEQTFAPSHENADACGGYECFVGTKGIVIAGGHMNVHGLPDNTPTWLPLYNVDGDESLSSALIVSDSVFGKWGLGAEILITSHTTQWDNQQVRTIVGIDRQADGLVRLDLDAPIERPTTYLDSPDFAVEVALLTRNVQFRGGFDSYGTRGAHLWFANTPRVPQTLVGVDIVNFGQQGHLGRYPIHLHFCGDSTGTIIAKNTIRESNQRCVVVHGTDNVLIQENVAYDTKGHCFMLEDGIETGNRFVKNLGAKTGAPKVVIPDHGSNGIETDYNPATFWITNPSNEWVGNVAAGSESSGFWFELLLRGLRKDWFPDMNPKRAPLTLFRDNVVHSCTGKALRTYPSGYISETMAVFEGMRIYRNQNTGVFFHNSKNLVVKDSVLADNRISLDIDRADGVHVVNTTFVGKSDSFGAWQTRVGIPQDQCRRDNLPVIGVELHTWKNNPDEGSIRLDQVSFVGFAEHPCEVTVPIQLDDTTKTGMFDLYTSLTNVTLEGQSNLVNFCSRRTGKSITDMYMVDRDGSFRSPSDDPTTLDATLIGHTTALEVFVDPIKCNLHEQGCYSFCRDTCFRSIRYEVDPSVSYDLKLRVCRRDDVSHCLVLDGFRRAEYPRWSLRRRTFVMHLPTGEYEATFVDEAGVPSWPLYVNEIVEDNECRYSGNDHSVTLSVPSLETGDCDALVKDPNLESSSMHWMYRLGDAAMAQGAGIDGSNALIGRFGERTSIVQNLDSRCISKQGGSMYKLHAKVKLVLLDGTTFVCSRRIIGCPWVGVYSRHQGFRNVARVLEEVPMVDGFQTFEGVWRSETDHLPTDEVFLYVDANMPKSRLVVDSISLELLEGYDPLPDDTPEETDPSPAPPTLSPSVIDSCREQIANTDMQLGYEGYWMTNGLGTIEDYQIVGGGTAIRVSDRLFGWNGPLYTATNSMDYSCFQGGSTWVVKAQVMLVDSVTGAGTDCDLAWSCPAVRIEINDTHGKPMLVKQVRQYENDWKPDELNWFRTTLDLSVSFDQRIGNIVVDIRDFPLGMDLIVGHFSITSADESTDAYE